MKVTIEPITKIRPYENNPRKNDKAVSVVMASLKEFGWRQPIVVDAENVIIAGHTRYHAAMDMGLAEVPVHVAEGLTEEQVRAYRLADNKTGEYAEWDMAKVRIELNELKAKQYDVAHTGFKIRDLALLGHGSKEGKTDPEDIPEPPKEPTTKHGQIWKLGAHQLMCGSAIEQTDVSRLMDGKSADMVFTDPPYNVNYEGGTGLKIENDNMGDENFNSFLHMAFLQMQRTMKPGAPIYVCYASSEGLNFYDAFKKAGLLFKQELIWVKNSLVLGRQDYQWQHEPIMYGWRDGGAHKWYGGFKETTILDDDVDLKGLDKKELIGLVRQFQNDRNSTVVRVDKPSRNKEHPTMKPVSLVEHFIRNSSEKDDIVLDPFGGSGSTLMACEKSYRACRTMELDPIYCDVIIKRWEDFTGNKAELISE